MRYISTTSIAPTIAVGHRASISATGKSLNSSAVTYTGTG